jgi:hypothetical protein
MKNSRFWLAVVAVFLVGQGLSYVVHQKLLASTYAATASVWRPEADMASKMPLMFLTGFIFSFFFVLIFARGYQERGLAEGVRYGVLIGLFYSLPVAYENYVVLPIPYPLALHWFLSGLVTCVVLGIVAAWVYRPQPA